MDLSFEDDALQHRCACEEASVKAWGAVHARIVRRRMLQLAAAESMAVVRSFPFCTLNHATNGRYMLHSDDGLRIILAADPDESVGDGEAEIREICVLAVEVADGD